MTASRTDEEEIEFDGLTIRFDSRVLRPRAWTTAQSRWAAALLDRLPPGQVLELCTGAGQIGLAAIAATQRRLVAIDADPVAAEFARANAVAAGLAHRVEIRAADMAEALEQTETFVLVVADPPWVPAGETDRYPEDPLRAIDGGPDGLAVAGSCLEIVGAHLAPEGRALLQLGSLQQAESLAPAIERAGLRTIGVRSHQGGVLVEMGRIAR